MFQKIEKQGGSGEPEWLSSHPNPGHEQRSVFTHGAMPRWLGS
jgi:hypothetical protein